MILMIFSFYYLFTKEDQKWDQVLSTEAKINRYFH
jgi:hypothetical protein